MWQITNRAHIYKDEFVDFYKDDLVSPSGRDCFYSHFSGINGVVIVPIELTETGINYILVEQYRHPIGTSSLELPRGGLKIPSEDFLLAGFRELQEETGYHAERSKLLGFFHPMNNASNIKCGVLLVQVGRQESTNLDEEEVDSGLTLKKLSAEKLISAIQNNEIMDGHTLSALTMALFNSKKIKEFVGDRGML
jgi:8-oxo-dGTP pyrophosphatase MutT (NUDIX family)